MTCRIGTLHLFVYYIFSNDCYLGRKLYFLNILTVAFIFNVFKFAHKIFRYITERSKIYNDQIKA